jgi:hypothetical protein
MCISAGAWQPEGQEEEASWERLRVLKVLSK